MPYDGYESSDKCVDFIILEKEFFCLRVFLFRDEDIFPVSFEKWLSEPSTEDIVVRKSAHDRAPSHPTRVARNGSILPATADTPAGIMTSSDGTGMIDDSIAMRTNISRYPIVPK